MSRRQIFPKNDYFQIRCAILYDITIGVRWDTNGINAVLRNKIMFFRLCKSSSGAQKVHVDLNISFFDKVSLKSYILHSQGTC